MKLNTRLFILSFLIVLLACNENTPNYIDLAKTSISKSNFSLARNQLNMIKQNHENYEQVGLLLKKIDSLEEVELQNRIKKDSISNKTKELLLNRHSGNYIINVGENNSIESAEIYILSNTGNAIWLWVYNPYSTNPTIDKIKNGTWSIIDNEIVISIGGSKEIYEDFNGVRREKKITKRFLTKTNREFTK